MNQKTIRNKGLEIINLYQQKSHQQIVKEIVNGLFRKQPQLPSKYFYDDLGTELFIKITQLQEYYPTRTEISILQSLPSQLFDRPWQSIIELGSGNASKIKHIFSRLSPKNLQTTHYFPVDISQHAIQISASDLANAFPQVTITGIVMDFMTQLDQMPDLTNKVYFFLGSTLGNLGSDEAIYFLSSLSQTMSDDDRFYLGIDMVKDENILHLAYNDSQGITAQFNKNILRVVNRLIDSDFDVNDFEHLAFFNREHSRIEMHLLALRDVIATSPYFPTELTIRKGQTIHTENSYKYTLDLIASTLDQAGLSIKQVFQDPKKWFSLLEVVNL